MLHDFQPFLVRSEQKTMVFFDSSTERAEMHFRNMAPDQEIIESRSATNEEIAIYSSKKKES
jgi:hypothetical protein